MVKGYINEFIISNTILVWASFERLHANFNMDVDVKDKKKHIT